MPNLETKTTFVKMLRTYLSPIKISSKISFRWIFSSFSCMFLNPTIFSNLNTNCSNLVYLRNLLEQVKKPVLFKEGHVRFCKRRGADGFFFIPHQLQFATFTFHLFWVNTLLSQGRAALHCSKIERQISHENECLDIFFFIFVIFFIICTFFISNLYT